MEIVGILILCLFLAIPISVLVRIVAALFSARVRDSIEQHPVVHLIWLAAGVAVVILIWSLPPLTSQRLKKHASFMRPDSLVQQTRDTRCILQFGCQWSRATGMSAFDKRRIG